MTHVTNVTRNGAVKKNKIVTNKSIFNIYIVCTFLSKMTVKCIISHLQVLNAYSIISYCTFIQNCNKEE